MTSIPTPSDPSPNSLPLEFDDDTEIIIRLREAVALAETLFEDRIANPALGYCLQRILLEIHLLYSRRPSTVVAPSDEVQA
ncbi:MAG: hypothetical protein KA204_04115 [Chromatiaceae bacterium]|nr:hypothetical protein [Chromatiaceae bacterium]MBP6582643.1 hypothetical protein [Chromatiaceae bacterium]MBP8197115.1 hypothetical protein [Chromatiaceae bacterium]MBP8282567.1 hypothetical protein [Chromatiaceae bacterium]MBP9603934.1 hypothetical protein [Chromatiaceae bacterium]